MFAAAAPADASRRRELAVIGAASDIGIKPYDDGTARAVDRAPSALLTRVFDRAVGTPAL